MIVKIGIQELDKFIPFFGIDNQSFRLESQDSREDAQWTLDMFKKAITTINNEINFIEI